MCQQMTETHSHEPNIWAPRLISLTLILLGISFAGILILGSYYDQPITQALSFLVQDSERFDSGFGMHSFGDFQELRFALPTSEYPNFWANSNAAYTPTSLIPNLIAKQIQEIFGIEVSLYSFLLLLLIALSSPAIYAVRKTKGQINTVTVFIVLTVFAQPFITTFDRGNNIGFLVPFLAIFTVGYFTSRNWIATLGIVGAFVIRPQFALLGIALLLAKDIKKSATTALLAGSIFFTSFLFMPGKYTDSFAAWLRNIRNYANYNYGAPFPANLSLSTAFNRSLEIFNYRDLAVVFVAITLVIYFKFGCKDSRGRILISTLCMTCLIPKVSFGYYSVFVLVIAAMIISEPRFLEPPLISCSEKNSRRQIKTRVAYNYLVITVVAISLAPIPFVREVGRNSIALESFSTLWTIVLIATLAQQIVEHYNEKVAE
jgi:hypothetical protein